MNVYVFLTPPAFWRRAEVSVAVGEATAAARRLAKAVDPGRERLRLAAALRTVDQTVRSVCPTPRLLEGEEGSTLVAALPVVGSTRLPFKILDDHPSLGGFVVAPVPYDPRSTFAPPPDAEPARPSPAAAGAPSETRARGSLASEVAAARSTGRPIPLGRARHWEITAALRANLHARDGASEYELRFVYSDGSPSGPIRLGSSPRAPQPVPEVQVSVGLNSCRHFDIDIDIDFYLLRTADFERRSHQTFAEQEEFAYGRMEALLAGYCSQRLGMTLYHTGLEPAVIGSYRAVIDALRGGQSLIVVPVVHQDAPPGEAWW